jgi:signal transduction histidine kinase
MLESSDGQVEILATLQIAVFERTRSGRFQLVGNPPDWVIHCFGRVLEKGGTIDLEERFPYLSAVLEETEAPQAQARPNPYRSGIWMETDPAGGEMPLEATVLDLGGRRLILIENSSSRFEERQSLYQKARENLLIHQSLVREIQQKEVLLHCIIHDLGGPLMGINSCLQWLDQEDLTERGSRRLEIGIRASKKLSSLIQDILTVFKDESEPVSRDSGVSVDILACVRTVVNVLGPAAALGNVQLSEKSEPPEGFSWVTVGEPLRAERVLFNLVENAIRYSPVMGAITITLTPIDDGVEVSVEDEGPGVPEEVVPNLFRKFGQAGNPKGKAGLGLYFRNIMISRVNWRIHSADRRNSTPA